MIAITSTAFQWPSESHSVMSDSLQPYSKAIAFQSPLSVEFSKQEY